MILYLDCTSGISSDMLLNALIQLGGNTEEAEKLRLPSGGHKHAESAREHTEHSHSHSHNHAHRSHRQIRELIENSELSIEVKKTVLAIYEVIAGGEAKVHNSTIEDVHFHEVGRDQAIRNLTGIAAALKDLKITEIYCSELHDGKGFIQCSHGTIPVPVPAVMAMRENCDYVFVTDNIETEMVTPSGLGALMGIGARYTKEMSKGKIVSTTVAKGGRETGKDGLKAVLIEGESL